MKRIVSIIILIVALIGITFGTIYTLTHKGIRLEVENETRQTIEKITSNKSNQSLSEIYNVLLNKEKHKLKLEYSFIQENSQSYIELLIYFDGRSILDEVIMVSKEHTFANALDSLEFDSVQIQKENLKILTFGEKDYLFIDLFYVLENHQEKYYLFNSQGESYFKNGILVFDDSVQYKSDLNDDLNFFYDNDKQTMAKCDNDAIYVLELKKGKKNSQFLEYKYYIQDDVLEKELLNTYNNIQKEEIKKK